MKFLMTRARDDELRSFLSWRRKTRFLRHHGGPLLALILVVVCVWLIWQAQNRWTQKQGPEPAPSKKMLQR